MLRGGLVLSLPGRKEARLSHGLLSDPRLYVALARFDEELADDAQRAGCACGGRLHRADYPRKPRGVPHALGDHHSRRHSFCCDPDGCRRRTTPVSVRFLGRRVYFAAVVVLVAAMRHGPTPARQETLREWIGIRARTLDRWRAWWRETFPASAVWKSVCARLIPAPEVQTLPASWMASMGEMHEAERLQWILAWLLPLTSSTPGRGASFLMGV